MQKCTQYVKNKLKKIHALHVQLNNKVSTIECLTLVQVLLIDSRK